MSNITTLIEHLDNPFALTGFVLLTLPILIKQLPINKLNDQAIERLLHKGFDYVFILGFISILLGFATPFLKNSQTDSNASNRTINTHLNSFPLDLKD